MTEEHIDARYLACYVSCEQFLIDALGTTIGELRAHVGSLLKTPNIKEYYKNLCDKAVGCDDFTHVCDAENFIHIIDHFDEMIHEEKRDKTGSYYTPETIVKEMVEGVIQTDYIKDKITKRLVLDTLEPSCGTMIFMRHLCDAIYSESNDLVYLKAVVNRITTVDVQVKPLILGVLGMLHKLYILTGEWDFTWSVRCEDSLAISFFEGKMDIVIGNPPYLGEKGNKDYFRYLKTMPTLEAYYEGRMDLYYFFIHRGIDALKSQGILSFITTNYFVTADSAFKLREHIKRETVFKRLVDYASDDVFKSARGQHNLSFILQKDELDQDKLCEVVVSGEKSNTIEAYKLFDDRGLIAFIDNKMDYDLLEKIVSLSDGPLSNCFDVKQGIVSGADVVTNRMMNNGYLEEGDAIKKGTPIYVFPRSDSKPFDGPWRLFYKNSDIGPYKLAKEAAYEIYYATETTKPSEDGFAYLEIFKEVLSRRREVGLGYREWYELQWPRTATLFEQAKIVMPQRSKRNVFAYSEEPLYGSADIYYIIHENEDRRALKYLNGLLNSKLYFYWLYHRGKKKGDLLELYSTPIKSLPMIHYKGQAWQEQIVEYMDRILGLKFEDTDELRTYVDKIDLLIYEGFSLLDEEIKQVENIYEKTQQ